MDLILDRPIITKEEFYILTPATFATLEAINEKFANIYIDVFNLDLLLLEVMANKLDHMIWAFCSMAIIAPLNDHTLILLIDENGKASLKEVLLQLAKETTNVFNHAISIGCPLGMNAFDHHRCQSPFGILTTSKNVGSIRGKRDGNYFFQPFNFYSPYLKCACERNGHAESCRSKYIIWFSHALRFMMHSLENFFKHICLSK